MAAPGSAIDTVRFTVALIAADKQFVRDLSRYGCASVAALALDWGLLIMLIRLGFAPLAAGAAGFLAGMGLAYALSVTFVYSDRRRGSTLREAATFFAVGFAGLALNQALLAVFMAGLGLPAPIAKAPTAGIVFLFNFLVRRVVVFSAPDAASTAAQATHLAR